MENLEIYEAVRKVPDSAIKTISSGRLKGMSDINPMWRIKKLTEQFGPCGIGWCYDITRQWMEQGAEGQIAAFCDILLYYKVGEDWSKGIPGTGGNLFVAKESKGLHTSDECYKMALTDAISVAAKALGIGADVYWNKDSTKYTGSAKPPEQPPKSSSPLPQVEKKPIPKYIGPAEQEEILQELHRTGWNIKEMMQYLGKKFPGMPPADLGTITDVQYTFILGALKKKPTKE